MKKVGILTFHRAHNYGASLQVYALYEVLKNIYEVKIIDYYNNYIYDQYKLFSMPSKNILKFIKKTIFTVIHFKSKKARYDSFEKFISENINMTKRYTNETIHNIDIENFSAIIAGSDQIWSIGTVGELSDIYTLAFLPNSINKISYAASVGNSEDIINYAKDYKNKLSDIKHISVREEDAKEKLSSLLGRDVFEALDPTMLLGKEVWEERISDLGEEGEKYILAYVVEPNDEYIKIVNELSYRTGLKVLHFGLKNPGYNNVYKSKYYEGPLAFVNYIKNAEYIITTSFHGTVFSIIFNKKFWVVPHKKTGERVTSLLTKLGIPNRAIKSFDEFCSNNHDESINYKEVNRKLNQERKKSIEWLFSSIEK